MDPPLRVRVSMIPAKKETKLRTRSQDSLSTKTIERRIYLIRGHRVMLDSDLAEVYEVETRTLVQAVMRNEQRFPQDFMFRLTPKEWSSLRSQFVISKGRGGRRYLPYAFTEHGAIMAATILNSERAVAMSVYVVRAFVKFRKLLAGDKDLAGKLATLERKLTERLDVHEEAILRLFAEIREILNPPLPPEPEKPRRRIGFHGDQPSGGERPHERLSREM